VNMRYWRTASKLISDHLVFDGPRAAQSAACRRVNELAQYIRR
jgi:hypothetical protein